MIHLINNVLVLFRAKFDRGLKRNLNSKPLNYKFLSMDDMPVPSGSWKEHYAKQNKRYNRILMFGIVSLIGSISIVSLTN